MSRYDPITDFCHVIKNSVVPNTKIKATTMYFLDRIAQINAIGTSAFWAMFNRYAQIPEYISRDEYLAVYEFSGLNSIFLLPRITSKQSETIVKI